MPCIWLWLWLFDVGMKPRPLQQLSVQIASLVPATQIFKSFQIFLITFRVRCLPGEKKLRDIHKWRHNIISVGVGTCVTVWGNCNVTEGVGSKFGSIFCKVIEEWPLEVLRYYRQTFFFITCYKNMFDQVNQILLEWIGSFCKIGKDLGKDKHQLEK